jgi:protein CpxP
MRGDDGPPGPHGLFGRGLHRLDLTEEQQTKIDALFADARPALDSLREQLHTMRSTFRTAQAPGSFDEAAIRAQVAKRAAVQADLAVKAAKVRADVFAVLTPEQQKQLAEMKEECPQGGAGRRHGGRW